MAVTVRTRTESALRDKRRLQVTRAAAEAAVKMGFNVDQVIEMAYVSVPVRGDNRANFRFKDVLLFLDEGTVYGIWPHTDAVPRRAEPPPPRVHKDARPALAERVCPICEGEGGCNECQDRGTVRRTDEEYARLKFLALTGG